MDLSGTLDTIGQIDSWTFSGNKTIFSRHSENKCDVLFAAVPSDSSATPGASIILPLAKALQNNKPLDDVQGTMFKKNGETIRTEKPPLAELTDLPGIDRDLIDKDILKIFIVRKNPIGDNVRSLPMLTGLGYQFLFTFYHNIIFKQTHRTLSTKSIIAEVKRLRHKYNLTEVGFVDEIFFSNRPRFLSLLTYWKWGP